MKMGDEKGKEDLSSRGKTCLDSGMLADCEFIVGENKKVFKACSQVLALASPVFEKMFFGSLERENQVTIPDAEPDNFYKLLIFIYTREINIKSWNEAEDLCRLADKYMISDLVEKCVEKFKPKNLNEVWEALKTAEIFEAKNLEKAAMKIICENTRTVLNSPKFLDLSAYSVGEICKEDNLQIYSEKQLLEAVLKWASAQCRKKKIAVNALNKRKELDAGNIIENIRLAEISIDDLCNYDPLKGIFTSEEIGNAVLEQTSTNKKTVLKTRKYITDLNILEIKDIRNWHQLQTKNLDIWKLIDCDSTITERFEVNTKTLILDEICISAQVAPYETSNFSYYEKLNVVLKRNSTDLATCTFSGRVKYENVEEHIRELNCVDTIGLKFNYINGKTHIFTKGNVFQICIKFGVKGVYNTYEFSGYCNNIRPVWNDDNSYQTGFVKAIKYWYS